uniref:Uncharacterized protein n=1 Tax=viral metagenome TaxID=1070528 RepID=A0A6C0CSQ1_9ZZZZ
MDILNNRTFFRRLCAVQDGDTYKQRRIKQMRVVMNELKQSVTTCTGCDRHVFPRRALNQTRENFLFNRAYLLSMGVCLLCFCKRLPVR